MVAMMYRRGPTLLPSLRAAALREAPTARAISFFDLGPTRRSRRLRRAAVSASDRRVKRGLRCRGATALNTKLEQSASSPGY